MTVDEMMGYCLLSGWTEQQFWRSTFRAVYNLIRTKVREDKRLMRERWEQTRVICKYAGRSNRPFDLPWDKENEPEVKVLSEAEQAAQFAKRDALVKKRFQANGTQ